MARPSENTGRAQQNRRPGIPRATFKTPENRSEGVSRTTLQPACPKRAPRLLSDTLLDRFAAFRERSEALRERPGSSPSASRSVPGASSKPPESSRIAPTPPESDLGRFPGDFRWIWARFWLHFRSMFVLRLSDCAFVRSIFRLQFVWAARHKVKKRIA